MINMAGLPSDDPIKNIQNLLNNCLTSLSDVFSNLSYKGEAKELEVNSGNASEYNHFLNLLENYEKEKSQNNVELLKDRRKEENQLEEPKEESRFFIKPTYEESIKNEILDRVERFNLILKTIDENIKELPDSIMIEEEKCKEIKMLQEKKDKAKEELMQLYATYDSIYGYISKHLRNIVVK